MKHSNQLQNQLETNPSSAEQQASGPLVCEQNFNEVAKQCALYEHVCFLFRLAPNLEHVIMKLTYVFSTVLSENAVIIDNRPINAISEKLCSECLRQFC